MGMRSWSIPAGQWFGINVRVHLTFFFLLLFVWMTESKGADPTNTLLLSLDFTGLHLAGGRVLRDLLSRHMDYALATRRAVNVANLFVISLMAARLWNTWLMLAGFFLFVGAQLEERTVLFQSVLENVRMEEVMLTE